MCGRYASSRRPEDLVEEFEIEQSEVAQPLPADYNVAPTKEVYAVVQRPARPASRDDEEDRPEQRQLRVLTWGLVPSWAKDPSIGNKMINARMETADQKPAYRKAFAVRRCLLPADGYYEWYTPQQQDGPDAATSRQDAGEGTSRGTRKGTGKPRKQPFFVRPDDGSVLAMAGLYEIWRDPTRGDDDPARFRWTCTVLTTEAPDDLGRIHDRTPLLVPRERYDTWLDPSFSTAEELKSLLVPAAPGLLQAYPVSTLVNNVAHNGAELIEPLPLADGSLQGEG